MKQDDIKKTAAFESGLKSPITRRSFLKTAGFTGLALGATGGLTGALAACGSDSSGGGDGEGRTIKIGFVTPLTGALSSFGETDKWSVKQWESYVKDGLECGDGQVHPVEFIVKDSQSDSNRAATVAGDLITNDGVDVMMVGSTPDTVVPVADQAEALQIPCVSNDCPWQPYYFGRGATPETPFTWTYHFHFGLEDVTATFVNMWDQLKTNKKIGEMWGNDADGLAWSDPDTGQPPILTKGGYEFIDSGRFQIGTDDFTPQISKFKGAGVDIVSGNMMPPDFVNFWKQCYQQGLKPMACTIGKALLFPSQVEAAGEIGYGLSSEVWWAPTYPFASSLTGQSCQEIADAYTSDTGNQWSQPLMHYAIFEVVADSLKRATDIDDKQTILDAIKATDMNTVAGPVTWSAGAPLNPVPNICKTALAGGQWVKGEKWPFEIKLVSNVVAPAITVQQDMAVIKY